MYMHILESGHDVPFMYRTLKFLETYDAPPEFIYAPIYEKLLFAELARSFWLKAYFDDCLKTFELFRSKYGDSSAVAVKIFPLVGSAYFNLRRYTEAIKYYELFFQAVERYKNVEFADFADVRFVRGDELTPDDYLTQIHKDNLKSAHEKIEEAPPSFDNCEYDIYYDLADSAKLAERVIGLPKKTVTAQLSLSTSLHQTRFAESALAFVQSAPHDFRQTLTGVDFLVNLLEKAVLLPTFALSDEEKANLYYAFAEQLIVFVTNVYNPAILNETDIVVLPETHVFGYWLNRAFNADDAHEKVRVFKKALDINSAFGDLVKVFVRDIA